MFKKERKERNNNHIYYSYSSIVSTAALVAVAVAVDVAADVAFVVPVLLANCWNESSTPELVIDY